MQNKNYNDRFKDAPWYANSENEKILVVGAGGIGSNAMHCLSKTIPANYVIVDDDIVESYNIGTQFFQTSHIGINKVVAVANNALTFGSSAKVQPVTYKYDESMYRPIVITGLDNMATRKQVYEAWKQHEDRELLIDGRLLANMYIIYTVQKGQEEEYEKTLLSDSEIDDAPCTFKQTAYMAMMIGARITQILVNYLINKYSEEPTAVVPFKVKEYSEIFYYENI